MAKQQLEVELNSKTDAFSVQKYLQRCVGIKKCYAVTCSSLLIIYDDKKTQAKLIAKWIGCVGREQGRRRITNIVSLRQTPINTHQKNATT